MLIFRKGYFIWAIAIFIIEVIIALFVKDDIIRPHIGDLLVVIMIYCFVRAFLNISVNKAVIATLLFAYLIETLQYLNVVEWLGLQKNKFASVVIGTYFSWVDMLAYTAGIAIVLLIEKWRKGKNKLA